MLLGASLIIYPYLVESPWLVWGIGAGLTTALIAWRD